MPTFSTLASLALLLVPVFSAPASSQIEVQRVSGAKVDGSYIVKLKDGVDKKSTLDWLLPHLSQGSTVTHEYSDSNLNGFSGSFTKEVLDALTSSKDIEYITEDAIFSIKATQSDAPWGLNRISQKTKLNGTDTDGLTYTYTYDDKAGEGVDVYVLDTGINIEHEQFEGRAKWGYSAVEGDKDGNGHGTHCAGTIGGKQFGVAKKANLFAVKVLSDEGSGATSGIIAGIDYVIKRAKETGHPSIISMSLGGAADEVLDKGVSAAVEAGVHVVVAAGNENVDAGQTSPARVPTVITVGAMGINDTRAKFSNFGEVVDVFAPGVDIISAWMGSPNATKKISGTSMATPHVAGLAAYLLSTAGPIAPAELATKIKTMAVTGALTEIPSGTTDALVQNA